MKGPVWGFAGFEFSAGEGLRRDGDLIALQPKVRQLLELLLRAEGAVVTKTAIAAALWPREAASDESISRLAHLLRRALGDKSGESVRTVYGEGLRLQGATEVRGALEPADRAPAAQAFRQSVYEIAAGRTTTGLNRALAALRGALAKDPDNADAWSLCAEATVSLTTRGALAPRVAGSQICDYASTALRLNPRHAIAMASLGWARAVIGKQIEEGRRRVDQAVEWAPTTAMPRYLRAWLRVHVRDLSGAFADVEAGLAAEPLDRALLNLRARVLLYMGRVDEADAFARDALRLRPDVDTLLYTRVVIASRRGDPAAAVDFAEKATQITGGERVSLALLAFALAGAGRESEARRTLDAASVGYPTTAFLAPAWVALGDIETARKVLREADENGCPWRSFTWCSPTLARL